MEGITDITVVFKERIIYILDPYKKNTELEYVKELLALERKRNDDLVEYLTRTDIDNEPYNTEDYKPLNNFKPFRVIRKELEAKHREKKTLKDNIEALEKELKVNSDAS